MYKVAYRWQSKDITASKGIPTSAQKSKGTQAWQVKQMISSTRNHLDSSNYDLPRSHL